MQLRAPKNDLKRPRTITIEDFLWQFAKDVGSGNASLGVRFILQRAYEETEANAKKESEDT